MATINAFDHSLLDITQRLDPNGKLSDIAEVLTNTNEMLLDMPWKEGNLVTGERTTVRRTKPKAYFRALNEGVPRSKSTVGTVDDGAAMLEAFSQVDRKNAILSSNIAKYRLDEANSFLEAMNDAMAEAVWYGDASLTPKAFTGITPRYNLLAGDTKDQIIDAGGSGANLRSIWLIGWAPDKITGIYPKGTKAGLMHNDATANSSPAGDGHPIGDVLFDDDNNQFLGYRDHYEWNCGFSVKDYRYAVRVANIDLATLSKSKATGADLEDILIQASERLHSKTGCRPTWYMCSRLRTWLRQQMVNGKSPFLGQSEYGGRQVTFFDEIPIRRSDALNVNETRVV